MINLPKGDPFRSECESAEGDALRKLIEAHSDEMVRASAAGRPALEAVIPHLPLYLAAELRQRDRLMQAFGHMAWLEMQDRGLDEQGPVRTYEWPTIRGTSDLATFRQKSGQPAAR